MLLRCSFVRLCSLRTPIDYKSNRNVTVKISNARSHRPIPQQHVLYVSLPKCQKVECDNNKSEQSANGRAADACGNGFTVAVARRAQKLQPFAAQNSRSHRSDATRRRPIQYRISELNCSISYSIYDGRSPTFVAEQLTFISRRTKREREKERVPDHLIWMESLVL